MQLGVLKYRLEQRLKVGNAGVEGITTYGKGVMAKVRNASNEVAQWYPRLLYTARPLVTAVPHTIAIQHKSTAAHILFEGNTQRLAGDTMVFLLQLGCCAACRAQTLDFGHGMKIAVGKLTLNPKQREYPSKCCPCEAIRCQSTCRKGWICVNQECEDARVNQDSSSSDTTISTKEF